MSLERSKFTKTIEQTCIVRTFDCTAGVLSSSEPHVMAHISQRHQSSRKPRVSWYFSNSGHAPPVGGAGITHLSQVSGAAATCTYFCALQTFRENDTSIRHIRRQTRPTVEKAGPAPPPPPREIRVVIWARSLALLEQAIESFSFPPKRNVTHRKFLHPPALTLQTSLIRPSKRPAV